jgi:acetolactate synthase regulatory subunit
MGHYTYFLIEARDCPDVLVRITQALHRRGGHVRSLYVEPRDAPWSYVHLHAFDVERLDLVVKHLEKLVDVRQVRHAKQVMTEKA